MPSPQHIPILNHSAGCLLAAVMSATTFAQAPAPIAEPAGLQPVDQGIEDIGALNTTLRVQRADLRVASDFDRVYRAPGNDNSLMRIDGALHAVFAESEYLRTEKGSKPIIPAGTTWVIGGASPGCTDPANPVCNQLPAQHPFFMPGPTGLPTPRARPSAPPPGAVALIALPRANYLGRAVASHPDTRIDSSIVPPTAITPKDAPPQRPAATHSPMPRSFDLSDPFYRRARLREIAKRHGPK